MLNLCSASINRLVVKKPPLIVVVPIALTSLFDNSSTALRQLLGSIFK